MISSIVRFVAAFLVFAALTPPQRAAAQAAVDAAVIEDLVLASRILANEGVLDAYGHVSIRLGAVEGEGEGEVTARPRKKGPALECGARVG